MHTQEVFSADNTRHLASPEEHETFASNMLQMAWFEYRCQHLSEAEIEAAAEAIARTEPESVRQESIRQGDLEVKRNALLQEMILPAGSTWGSAERAWYRRVFPHAEDGSPDPVYQALLKRFVADPQTVLAELEALYQESITTH